MFMLLSNAVILKASNLYCSVSQKKHRTTVINMT